MYEFNRSEKSQIYFDSEIEDLSPLGIGYLIRAIGEGKKIAYISSFKSLKFSNFIENLSLSYSFVNSLKRFQVDIYSFKDENKISKTLIPLVEFCNISEDMFWKSMDNYDIIIFDNFRISQKNKIKFLATLNNRSPLTKIVLITNNEKHFNFLQEYFNKKTVINYDSNKQASLVKKNIINIIGNGRGKSLYAFGLLIERFIFKNQVKLIYFDKGDDIYGDAFFFKSLKKWSIENSLYGTFDFVKTGIKRFDGRGFRVKNNFLDSKEAKESLDLLNTSLKKLSPVIADELNTIIEKNILDLNEVLKVLNNVRNELIITGESSSKKIISMSSKVIELKDL